MALVNSDLFPAMMDLSEIHRKSLALEGIISYDPEKLIAGLKATSLHHLRRELDNATNRNANCLVTVRTLYLCEVYAGADRPGTWRTHFEGAQALILALKSSKNPVSSDQDDSGRFLQGGLGSQKIW
jgi:hypothetical protein